MAKDCFEKIIKYRYLLALIVFAVLVLFRINGSNISFWGNYIDESGKTTTIAGTPRGVRSDEWLVLVPNYLAQMNSDTDFSVNNKNITMSGQNVVITLDAPVKDVYTICHPQNWGFLFLSADYALSWYWNMKLILIILLAFELSMILTKQNRLISVLGSAWIALSPAVQWWFAQHVGNNVLFFEAMVVTFYYFLRFHDRLPLKTVFAFLFSLSCIGFVIPLYPPLQIPFGFLAIILFALIFSDFRKKLKLKISDIFVVLFVAAFTGAMLLHLYMIIKDAIPLINNTVYPGSRQKNGGGGKSFFFYSYLTNPLLPYVSVKIPNRNPSELSSFYNFLPAIFLALPALIKKRVSSIKYCIALTAFSVFFAAYMAWAFIPMPIARITLLSYVTNTRAMVVYSFASMLLSIWALAELSRSGGLSRVYSAAVTFAVGATYLLMYEFTEIKGSSHMSYYMIIILVLMLLNYMLLRARKKAFSVLMAGVVIISGATVNPINVGAGAILDNTISQEIRALDKMDSKAVFLSDSDPTDGSDMMSMLVYANGAHATGGINNYPDMAKWSLLDPKHTYEQVYNRSAHISFSLTNSKTSFVLTSAATFMVNINVNDIKKLKIKFVISKRDISSFDNSNVQFSAIYARDGKGYTIYSVTYADSAKK